jgi:ABC-2 type transport system ATP-binding protein
MKKELLAKMGLAPFGQRRAGALSGGMKQKLSLSTLLLSSPQLLILDEPTTGVDPLSRYEFFGIIQDLQRQGKTILLSTPYLDEAEKGDFVVFLKNGQVLLQDSITRLRRDFPGRLYRILPQKNVLEALAETRQNSAVGGYVYVRGRYLKYLPARSENVAALFPAAEIVEETPSLEDIYLYYVRGWSKAGDER